MQDSYYTSNLPASGAVPPDDPSARIAALEQQIAAYQHREAAAQQRIAALEDTLAAEQSHPQAAPHARLDTLLAVSAALLMTHEIDPLLDLVVREVARLFPGEHNALLFLQPPDTQRVVVRACIDDQIYELVLDETGGLSPTLMTPRAMLVGGQELLDILHALNLCPGKTFADNAPAWWPPASALLAPMRVEMRHTGALILFGTCEAYQYRPRDLPFVQALADFAAVAIVEIYQRQYTAALQHDLDKTQFLHREAQARLDTAQAQLLQSAKLAAVGELAASVAHEINNPLYAARNSLYLLEDMLPPESAGRQFLDIAQSELGRIARIITRMRDFYRPNRAELSGTDVNSLLSDTVEFVRTYLRHSQVRVTTDLDGRLPPMIAHGDQLRQVFLNLVLNACDAMPGGGVLHVVTQALPATTSDPNTAVIRISDTGTGIPDEHMEHLFEPFYTTKPQGTGLGLAISAHIVTQHGGQISVQSRVNKGTTFTVTMPIEREDT